MCCNLGEISVERRRKAIWAKIEMPTSISRGVYHHGKRHRFTVTPKDESLEAFKAALSELDEQVTKFKNASTPTTTRQSYRKRKGS